MRHILRLTLGIFVTLLLLAFVGSYLAEGFVFRWFEKDKLLRSQLIQSLVESAVSYKDPARLSPFLDRIAADERLHSIAICSNDGALIASSAEFTSLAECRGLKSDSPGTAATLLKQVRFQQTPFESSSGAYSLVIIHDLSTSTQRSAETRIIVLLFLFALAVFFAIATVLLNTLVVRRFLGAIRSSIRSELPNPSKYPDVPRELLPVLREIRALAREAGNRGHMISSDRIGWTAQILQKTVRETIGKGKVVVVSNREPYSHVYEKDTGKVVVNRPASGVVTALESVMCACQGTWIAHGSGSADRQTCDENDTVQVPPASPVYSLRRVWLTQEEEQGYYRGFCNSGLWPLSHLAHIRPVFRATDWAHFVQVNQKFADATIEECREADPTVLVQDFHVSLVPQMIRKVRPDSTIIFFWHSPWPNSEHFGICPWREEVLQGLLGSTILGFHTRSHVNNFLDTVDSYLECKVDRDESSVSFHGHTCTVRAYPISIDFQPKSLESVPEVGVCRKWVQERHAIPESVAIGIGVERVDYIKGLVEKFRAIEYLMENYPEYVGRFCFIQIASPSRTGVEAYDKFAIEVREFAEYVNRKFSQAAVPPIILLESNHSQDLINRYFRGADVCAVTSLHDGMNLVCKEFIAARSDNHGSLILSMFAGAAKELPEALIVNPYHTEQVAESFIKALSMSKTEQSRRMHSMREWIRSSNVYRWAGSMILDASLEQNRAKLSRTLSETDAAQPFQQKLVV